MGWKKRAIGICYNHESGCGIIIGACTKRTIDIFILLNGFHKFIWSEKHVIPSDGRKLPQNCEGGIKGIASEVALKFVRQTYKKAGLL